VAAIYLEGKGLLPEEKVADGFRVMDEEEGKGLCEASPVLRGYIRCGVCNQYTFTVRIAEGFKEGLYIFT